MTAASWILWVQRCIQFVGVSATSEASHLLPSHVGGKSVRNAVCLSELAKPSQRSQAGRVAFS